MSDLPLDFESRITRYTARLDAHLKTFTTDSARRTFLGAEHARWSERYASFQKRVDRGCPVDPQVGATDYLLTLAEIDRRIVTQLRAA